jgi:hypothetical protein
MQQKQKPNFFLALRVDADGINENVRRFQKDAKTWYPFLKPQAYTKQNKVHMTVAVITIGSVEVCLKFQLI